jgi:hypothetical protein
MNRQLPFSRSLSLYYYLRCTQHVPCMLRLLIFGASLAPSAQAQGPVCGVIRRRKVPLASASVMVSVSVSVSVPSPAPRLMNQQAE